VAGDVLSQTATAKQCCELSPASDAIPGQVAALTRRVKRYYQVFAVRQPLFLCTSHAVTASSKQHRCRAATDARLSPQAESAYESDALDKDHDGVLDEVTLEDVRMHCSEEPSLQNLVWQMDDANLEVRGGGVTRTQEGYFFRTLTYLL